MVKITQSVPKGQARNSSEEAVVELYDQLSDPQLPAYKRPLVEARLKQLLGLYPEYCLPTEQQFDEIFGQSRDTTRPG